MRGKFFEQFISEGFFCNVGKRYWKINCYSVTGDSLQQITQVNKLPNQCPLLCISSQPKFLELQASGSNGGGPASKSSFA